MMYQTDNFAGKDAVPYRDGVFYVCWNENRIFRHAGYRYTQGGNYGYKDRFSIFIRTGYDKSRSQGYDRMHRIHGRNAEAVESGRLYDGW